MEYRGTAYAINDIIFYWGLFQVEIVMQNTIEIHGLFVILSAHLN